MSKSLLRAAFSLFSVAIILFFVVSCQPENEGRQVVRTEYVETVEYLKELITAEIEKAGINGLSISLVDEEGIVWAEGFGFSDKANDVASTADTVYRVGSISKLFTDVGIMQLVEDGKIDLDAPITDYYLEFSLEDPFPDDEPVSLRRLMSHTSGIPRECRVGHYFDDSEPSIKETVLSLNGMRHVYPVGTRTKYSNVGITIVGHVLAEVSGQDYVAYLKEHILEPIGMDSSELLPTEEVRENLSKARMWIADEWNSRGTAIDAPLFSLGTLPAGNLFSTVKDVAKFHSMIFSGGMVAENRIIGSETLSSMFEKVTMANGSEGRFGLGFVIGEVSGTKTYGHGGEVYGFSSSFIGSPEHKVGVVVLSNEGMVNATTDKIAIKALQLMLKIKGVGEGVTETEYIEMPADELVEYTGDYESEYFWTKITSSENGLVFNFSGLPGWLYPTAKDEFVASGPDIFDTKVTFARDDKGGISGFEFRGQGFSVVGLETPAAPDHWENLTGVYGPDYLPIIVTIKYGHLYAFIEYLNDYRLIPVEGSDTIFDLKVGLYDGEQLEFKLSPDGTVEGIVLAGMEFAPLEK